MRPAAIDHVLFEDKQIRHWTNQRSDATDVGAVEQGLDITSEPR